MPSDESLKQGRNRSWLLIHTVQKIKTGSLGLTLQVETVFVSQ